MLPFASIAALLLTPLGTPAGGFHWQRIITPPANAATEQACVVLDAATFANAAPALRDLRLFQDGNELAYVVEESYDERALNSGITPDDDRSEYETVYAGPMEVRPPAGVAGQGQDAAQTSHEAPFGYFARTVIDPHVPVERIRIASMPAAVHTLELSALPLNSARPTALEVERHRLDANHDTWAFTLGANLQNRAEVTLVDQTPGERSERVFLEMRKRSLCYQPRSASPLVLYLGGGQGISAKTYGLANGFSVSANRPYASMGPLEPNPDLQAPNKPHLSRLLIAIAVLGLTLLLTLWVGLELLRKDKDRHKAAPSA